MSESKPIPEAPRVVGELSLSEMRLLEQLRGKANSVLLEIGNLEVRKALLLEQFGQCEAKAQEVLNGAAQRLGIPKGETWQVLPDGKVVAGPTPPET